MEVIFTQLLYTRQCVLQPLIVQGAIYTFIQILRFSVSKSLNRKLNFFSSVIIFLNSVKHTDQFSFSGMMENK